jgi:hypothetical protein
MSWGTTTPLLPTGTPLGDRYARRERLRAAPASWVLSTDARPLALEQASTAQSAIPVHLDVPQPRPSRPNGRTGGPPAT